MALISWTEAQFGTKVGFADDEHKDIFNLLNKLYEEATGGAERSQIGDSLDALITCVVDHFAHEEREMDAKGFSDLVAHKEEHDKLIATCADLQTKFHVGEADVTDEVGQMVKDWLVGHIPSYDFAYTETLNS